MHKQKTIVVTGLVALTVLVATIVLTVTLGTTSEIRGSASPEPVRLDSTVVEMTIAAQFQDIEGVGVKELTCPDRMVDMVGATYECTGVTSDSEDIVLIVEVTEDGLTYSER